MHFQQKQRSWRKVAFAGLPPGSIRMHVPCGTYSAIYAVRMPDSLTGREAIGHESNNALQACIGLQVFKGAGRGFVFHVQLFIGTDMRQPQRLALQPAEAQYMAVLSGLCRLEMCQQTATLAEMLDTWRAHDQRLQAGNRTSEMAVWHGRRSAFVPSARRSRGQASPGAGGCCCCEAAFATAAACACCTISCWRCSCMLVAGIPGCPGCMTVELGCMAHPA